MPRPKGISSKPIKKRTGGVTYPKPKAGIHIDLQHSIDSSLREIDRRLYADKRDTLEVNRPRRVVPHYNFVPSHHHPDPV